MPVVRLFFRLAFAQNIFARRSTPLGFLPLSMDRWGRWSMRPAALWRQSRYLRVRQRQIHVPPSSMCLPLFYWLYSIPTVVTWAHTQVQPGRPTTQNVRYPWLPVEADSDSTDSPLRGPLTESPIVPLLACAANEFRAALYNCRPRLVRGRASTSTMLWQSSAGTARPTTSREPTPRADECALHICREAQSVVLRRVACLCADKAGS